MGKPLFVGVTCADMVINVDKLPQAAQDVVVYGQKMTLGGCAFNAFSIAHALGEPAMLFSPVGAGAFGDFVRRGLRYGESVDDAKTEGDRADIERAAVALARHVGNAVFATLGGDGCLYCDGGRSDVVAGSSAHVVDTIGAGDSHIGALMVGLHRGETPESAIVRANRVAVAIVGISGAHADPEVVRAAAGY